MTSITALPTEITVRARSSAEPNLRAATSIILLQTTCRLLAIAGARHPVQPRSIDFLVIFHKHVVTLVYRRWCRSSPQMVQAGLLKCMILAQITSIRTRPKPAPDLAPLSTCPWHGPTEPPQPTFGLTALTASRITWASAVPPVALMADTDVVPFPAASWAYQL